MICPKCGYAMGPFDAECARCKRLGKAAAETPAEKPAPELPPLPLAPVPISGQTPAVVQEAQKQQATGKCLLALIAIPVVGWLLLWGMCSMIPEVQEPYTAAEYEAWRAQIQATLQEGGVVGEVTYNADVHTQINVQVRGATKRAARDLGSGIATQYLRHFPKEDSCSVRITDYDSLETLHLDWYSFE